MDSCISLGDWQRPGTRYSRFKYVCTPTVNQKIANLEKIQMLKFQTWKISDVSILDTNCGTQFLKRFWHTHEPIYLNPRWFNQKYSVKNKQFDIIFCGVIYVIGLGSCYLLCGGMEEIFWKSDIILWRLPHRFSYYNPPLQFLWPLHSKFLSWVWDPELHIFPKPSLFHQCMECDVTNQNINKSLLMTNNFYSFPRC